MSILKVARLGHPVLRRVAEPVSSSEIARPEIQRLIDDMIETMHEYIGVPLMVIINPVLTPVSDEMATDWEGCLSIPDFRGVTPRYTAMRLEAYGRNGERIDLVAKDFFARVLQHETDHLNGKVYMDRMGDLTTLCHLQEWSRYWLEREEAE